VLDVCKNSNYSFIYLFIPFSIYSQRFSSQAVQRAASGSLSQTLFDLPTQIPLNEEVSGVPALRGSGPAPSAAQTTRLANGLTVVSEERNGSVSLTLLLCWYLNLSNTLFELLLLFPLPPPSLLL
jgi:hypothetical protein